MRLAGFGTGCFGIVGVGRKINGMGRMSYDCMK